MKQSGFTILELMITMLILLILCILAATYYYNYLAMAHNKLIFSAYKSLILKAEQTGFCTQDSFMTLGEYADLSINDAIINASVEIEKVGGTSQITNLMQLNKEQVCFQNEDQIIVTIPAGKKRPYPGYEIRYSNNNSKFICNGNPEYGQPNGAC